MTQFLKFITPKTKILMALILGGIVVLLFGMTLFGFLPARGSMEKVNRYNAAIGLARQTDANFQLAISKGKNFAILKDETNRVRTLDYFKKAQETFGNLSKMEGDPDGKKLLFHLGAGLHNVEFPLGILTSTAKKSDSAEKLYSEYLKDVTIDFDNASQTYVDYLENKLQSAASELTSETTNELIFALMGAMLALAGMGISYSISNSLNQGLQNEKNLEERYRVLSEITEEAIMIQDQGVVVDVNPALARLLGYEIEEIIGQHVSKFCDPTSSKMAEEYLKGGYPKESYEFTGIKKDGTRFPMLIHGRDLVYRGKKLRASSGWDLTDWKKAEKALLESEDRFKRFSEVTKEGILIHEVGKITDVNDTLAHMLGFSPEEMIGTEAIHYVTPETAGLALEKLKQRSEESYEIDLRRKDGTVFSAEIHGRNYSFAGKSLRVTSVWDLTEYKKAQKDLRDSEEKFRNLIENSNDIISITGKDGLMSYISPSVKRILGYEPSERIGKGYVHIMHPDDLERIKGEFARLLATQGASWTVEFRLKHKNGTWKYVESTGTNLLDQPSVQGIVYNLHDVTEKKLTEEALKKSEEHFRNLIEKSHDVISLVQKDGLTSYVSPSVWKILGYDPGERIGRPFHEIIHPEDRQGIEDFFRYLILNPSVTVTSEGRVRHKDGRWRHIEGSATNLLDNPDIEAIVLNYRDITEKVEAQEERRRSEENFRNLIEKAPDAVLVHQDDKIVYVNPKILYLLGYDDKEELLGKPGISIVHPEDQKGVAQRIQTLVQGGRTYPAEIRLIRRDGAETHVEASSIGIQFQGKSAIMVILRDLTSRKQAEAVARENQERYRSLVESMPDAVMVHDEENILFLNPAALRVFGAREQDELLGKSYWMIVPPEFQETVRSRIKATIERGVFNEPGERKLMRLDGGQADVLVTSVPFSDRGRRVVLAIFSDITARKEAERKAQRYQRLAALGELAAGMAHEIRNPTAAISAQAQYILKKTEERSPSYGQLKDIIQQCDRLDTLVHDTLDYSPERKFEERSEIPAKDILQRALWLAQTQFGPSHARVQVELDLSADLPILKVHPTRMERVLVNLILNAFQAMPNGGKLLLKASCIEKRFILRVEDNGKGITDAEMTRLFEPFFTSRKMGSGLGLAICQKIVEEHQGQIRVEKVEPHGAAFIVDLPLPKEKRS